MCNVTGCRSIVFSAATLLLVAAAPRVQAESAAVPPEPHLTFHTDEAGVRGVKLRVYLKAPPERIWGVVTTPSKAATLFKNVSTIRQSTRGPGFWDYHLDSILGAKLVTCRVERDDRRRSISWKRVEGHLVELRGYYRLSSEAAYPDHTRIDYGSYIDPGGIGRTLMTNGGRRTAVQHMIKQLRAMVEDAGATASVR